MYQSRVRETFKTLAVVAGQLADADGELVDGGDGGVLGAGIADVRLRYIEGVLEGVVVHGAYI